MKMFRFFVASISLFMAFIFSVSAKNINELSHEDMVYLADIGMYTATGRGYFLTAMSDHSENWAEVMTICAPLVKNRKFEAQIALAIRPSGEVAHLSIDPKKSGKKLKFEPFFNCLGENLMRGGYPEHPFSIYYLKFLAADKVNYKVFEERAKVKSALAGIWKSEVNGAYIKMDEYGKAYYCLYNTNRVPVKVVSLGNVDSNNQVKWGKFFMIRASEIFDLKEDLNNDFSSGYRQELEGDALKTVEFNSIQNSYLKTDKMDIMCD
jgi:hypothetical protein